MTIVLSEDRVNLNTPAIKSGPLTDAGLAAAQCPPCNAQGASASSELLQDDEAERRLSLTSWFWTAYLGILLAAVCAGIAHLLPALKALVNF